jgi:hypothetical protein
MAEALSCIVQGCVNQIVCPSPGGVCPTCLTMLRTGTVPLPGTSFIHNLHQLLQAALIDAARWRAVKTVEKPSAL